MIEAVPRDPYGGYISDLFSVEKNMQLRRRRLHAVLQPDEIAPSTGNFPMMGVEGYPHTKGSRGPVSNSEYLSDASINPHPRFGTLVRNIRARRQGNVNIQIPKASEGTVGPIRNDTAGRIAATVPASAESVSRSSNAKDSVIHMDAMAFGMGCCCLQITMQAKSDRESRFVHDQLATLAPLMLALSASTPIFKGQLAGTDTRWDVISQSVDDRTPAERGESGGWQVDPELVGGGVRRLHKSRYSSVSRYIGKALGDGERRALDALNDGDQDMDEDAYTLLVEGGLDASLAAHVAHLFVRDPLVIFDDAVYLDDRRVTDHFENIQSTNWRTIRWKTPSVGMGLEAEARAQRREAQKHSRGAGADGSEGLPTGKSGAHSTAAASGEKADRERDERDIQTFGPGWRVEFRPLEIQLTDFENAAFSLLTVLATRCLIAMGYNFYLPISLVEENMRRAQLQNAVLEQKFWVRKESFQPPFIAKNPSFGGVDSGRSLVPSVDEITPIELSLDEFFNGRQASPIDRVAGRQGDGFPGLIPAIYGYLEALGCDALTIGRLSPYLTLLQKRASGELPTAAHWMRSFVRSHPAYAGDGKVTPQIADDLLTRCDDIGMGLVQCPELVGDAYIEKLCVADVPEKYLLSSLKDKDDGACAECSEDPCCEEGTTKVRGVRCASYNPLNQCQTARPSDSCGTAPDDPMEQLPRQPWSIHVLAGSGMDPDTYLETSLLQ